MKQDCNLILKMETVISASDIGWPVTAKLLTEMVSQWGQNLSIKWQVLLDL